MDIEIKQLPLERFDEMDALFDMSSVADFRENRLKSLKAGNEICLIALKDNVIIGEISIMVQGINIPEAVIPNKRVYLFGFRVKEEHRNMGVGKALLANAISLCMKRGVFQFTVGVEKDNKRVKRLYESFGFITAGENYVEMCNGKPNKFDLMLLQTRK